MAGRRNITPVPVTKPLKLGEGPHWDEAKQLLFFVDMDNSQVHSYDPASKKHHYAKVDGNKAVTLIIPIENKTDQFIIGYDGDLDIISWDGKSSPSHELRRTRFLTLESDKDVRMNDGKASPSGVLFAGSMAKKLEDKTVPPGRGNLFMVKNDKQWKKVFSNIGISNGLAWNRAETEFYWNDTLPRQVYKFGYDSSSSNVTVTGEMSDCVIVDYEKANLKGNPDGMTIDTDGFLWIACVDGGGQVIKVDPRDGKILLVIPFPNVSDVSSVTFGGPKCEDLYVTTIQKDGEPDSGRLFVITHLGARGYPGTPVKL